MNFDASIPVIDMRDYYNSSRRHIFVGNLVKALQTVGFVAVVNSNIDPKILDHAYNMATEFYAQDTAKKMQAYGNGLNGQRGFVQSEVAAGQTPRAHALIALLAGGTESAQWFGPSLRAPLVPLPGMA